MNRAKNLKRVRDRREPWDIIVIGGGATGVGCALDAASRGLNVLLLEQHDFGKGTSSRSTKLVHGGVRYLAQGNISLVREALRERGILLRNAPHVVNKYEFVVPCKNIWEKAFYGIGLKIYDLLSGKLSFGRSRLLSKTETLERLPGIDPKQVSGGVSYFDGQFDDTRLLIDMAVMADKHGACLINYAGVLGLSKDGNGTTRLRVGNSINNEFFETQALVVINATGAFVDPIRKMSDPAATPIVTFARGSHIVLPRRFLPSKTALMIPKTHDGRVLFCIPWLDHLLVGTTDIPCETTELGSIVTDEEVDYLLETASSYLAEKPNRDDILSKFAGVRPLVSRVNTTNTAKLSRSHELFIDGNDLVTITGGKWTTYRQMAEEAVDAAITVGAFSAGKCVTASLTIDTPQPTSGERLHPDLPYNLEDISRAVRTEMAQTIEDVLARRTRSLFLNATAAKSVAPLAASVIAEGRQRNPAQISEDLIEFQLEAIKFGASERS